MSIRRNTTFNLGGHLAPLLITLITLPIYLDLIGEARYGVLTIVWVLLGYFGLFDLGLSRATAQRMARLRGAPESERGQLLWTALLLNSITGLVAAAVLWVASEAVLSRFGNMDEALRAEMLSAVPWLALALPVTILSSVLIGALEGRERFLALNCTRVLGIALSQLIPLAVAWLKTPHLGWLIPAALSARLFTGLILFVLCRRHVPLSVRPSLNWRLARTLFSYGGWITVSAVAGSFLNTFDRVLIGAIAGAKAVTFYSVPFALVFRVMVLPSSLSGALFPRLAAETEEKRASLSEQAIRVLSVIMTPVILIAIFATEPFLAIWISPEFAARSAIVGEIVLLGLWANSFAFIPHAALLARGRPEVVAKLHLAELLPYAAGLWVAISAWGIAGGALAWALRANVDAAALFWAYGASWRSLAPLGIPGLLLGVSGAVVFSLSWQSGLRWAMFLVLFVATATWAWLAAPPAVRDPFLSLVRQYCGANTREG